MENIPYEYRPLSPWSYFGYSILFSIPLLGFIMLIIFSFNNSNVNRRNYARSYFCIIILVIIIYVFLLLLGLSISDVVTNGTGLNNM